MTRPRSFPYPAPITSWQNQVGDSPPELVPSHPLGFLLPRAPNPNATPPVLFSFFPLSPNDMDHTTPTSPTPNTANLTLSCPPTFAPSQTVNPRSSQLFLQSQEASPASQPADSPPVPPTFAPSQTVNPRSSQLFLQTQEASPASQPANSPPVLRNQCITTDSEIIRQELEALTRQIEEAKRAESARISHPGLQILNSLLKSKSKPPN